MKINWKRLRYPALMIVFALVLVAAAFVITSPAPIPTYVSPLFLSPLKGEYRTVTPWATPPTDARIVNPGFEDPFICPVGTSGFCVAQGWHGWYMDAPCRPLSPGCSLPCPSNCLRPTGRCNAETGCWWQQPEFARIGLEWYRRIHSGTFAQKTFTGGRMGEWGVWQTVSVTPTAAVTFTIYVEGFLCDDWGNCPGGITSHYTNTASLNLRVGIDPTGGQVPTSTTILWSEPRDCFDVYCQMSVSAQAMGDRVTVFTSAAPRWPFAHQANDVYWDDAALDVVMPPVERHTLWLPFVASGEVAPAPPTPTPTAPPTPTPIPVTPGPVVTYPLPVNRGGLHVEATGSHTGYGTALNSCKNSGRSLGLVKSVCDGGVLMEARSVDPATVTVYRCPTYFDGGDDQDNPGNYDWEPWLSASIARRWFDANYNKWMLDYPYVSFYEPTNEGNPATEFQTRNFTEFHLELMRLADANNPPLKLAVGSFSAGTPERWQLEIMRPMFEYAAAHGHIVAWHDGPLEDYQSFEDAAIAQTALRYRYLYDLMGDAAPYVAITEGYHSGGYLRPNWPSLQWYLGQLAQDRVFGWAWFTLGQFSFGGDGDVNIQRQLPHYADALGCGDMVTRGLRRAR